MNRSILLLLFSWDVTIDPLPSTTFYFLLFLCFSVLNLESVPWLSLKLVSFTHIFFVKIVSGEGSKMKWNLFGILWDFILDVHQFLCFSFWTKESLSFHTCVYLPQAVKTSAEGFSIVKLRI